LYTPGDDPEEKHDPSKSEAEAVQRIDRWIDVHVPARAVHTGGGTL
jgi:predicted RNase H-like HicB family nuclease